MINLLRQNQRWLMLIIVILTIIAFAWLYNPTDVNKLENSRIAEIYGRTIHKVDIERQLKVYELAAILGETPFLEDLGSTAPTPEEAGSEFIWNLVVLQHEARQLGISPTDAQVVAAIQAVPGLQKNGTFDRDLYANVLQNVFAPRGMTERHLEDLVRDTLKLARLRQIITSPVAVTDSEVAGAFRGFQAVDVQYVRLEPAADPAGAATPEEVEKVFNEQKSAFATPEYRSIQYIRLSLPESSPALEGKARVDALQALAEQATQFVGRVLEKGEGFAQAAAASNQSVIQTPFFDQTGAGAPQTPAPAANLPAPVVQASFSLTEAKPVSEILQDGDAFYIAQLQKILPSRSLTLEEARPQIELRLVMQKTQETFQKFSEEQAQALKAAIQSGKTFAQAAGEAGLTVQSLVNYPPFQPSPSQQPDENAVIARATLPLEAGEVSGFQPAPWGGFLVQLTKRAPLDPMIYAQQHESVKTRILETKRNLLFIEWLTAAREEANLKFFAGQTSR
ncbi:MAG TPA: SurA N-terminal domain-containing protein [Chthoniobacterales bacterium]